MKTIKLRNLIDSDLVSYINENDPHHLKCLIKAFSNQNKLYWDRETLSKTIFSFPIRFLRKIYNFVEYLYYKNFGNEKKITNKFLKK